MMTRMTSPTTQKSPALVAQVGGGAGVEEIAVPAPAEGQVQLEMTHGGICGSDLHYYKEGRVGDFVIRYPLVLGHEVVGRVAEDPSGRWAAGTPVAIHPASTCHQCPDCLSGNPQVCRNATYLGSAASDPQTSGGFVRRLNVRLDQLRALPEGLDLSLAVLAEPLGVALHGINLAGDVAGKRCLVTGSGPIGALTVGALKARGAVEVVATDLLDNPLRIARAMGADEVVKVGVDQVEPMSFDVAFEASGAPAGLSSAIAATRRRGTIVQVGMLPGPTLTVAMAAINKAEHTIKGAFRFADEIDEALTMLASTPSLGSVITHTFPLGDAVEALETAADPAKSGKVVLKLDE